MKDMLLRQDNRITMARYELGLIEKRVMYFVLKEIRSQFVLNPDGQRDLFNDLIVKINVSQLVKAVDDNDNYSRVKSALKSLRHRSFEWDNGEVEFSEEYEWLEVGFIDWSKWKKKAQIEVQVSKTILPFYVELTRYYTEYSLIVAMSLRSRHSQRMYELCAQWRSAGGFRISVKELREMFKLDKSYSRYASFNLNVLKVAHKEIKELYEAGQCDLYFEYSEEKTRRTTENLRFKIFSKATDPNEVNIVDIDYQVRTELAYLFDTRNKPRNDDFVKQAMLVLQLNPDKLKEFNKTLARVKGSIPVEEQAKYIRYIIKEDVLGGGDED